VTAAWLLLSAALEPLFGGASDINFARRFKEMMVVGCFFYVLIAGLSYSSHGAARAAKAEAAAVQTQLAALRSQLQPHFLFNALNTISSTMYDDPRAADRMIGQLSQLLRLSLRTSNAQEVPLRDELDVLSCYLGLMQARFGSRLRTSIDAEPGMLDALVPSLLLQPLVENAIRHGNASRAMGGTIDIRVSRAGTTLLVDVSDDGPGAPSGTDVFGNGVGLSATRDRLRLLYGPGQRFEAGNRDGGFAVHIELPYRHAHGTPDAVAPNASTLEADDVVMPSAAGD